MANLTNCLLVSGLGLQCRENTGGVAEIYLANDIVNPFSYTLGTASNAGVITAFSSTASTFFRFEAPIETLSYASTGNFSIETQTSFYENTIQMNLFGLTTETHNTLKVLGKGAFKVMIKTNNNKYFLLNADAPAMQVSALEGGSGKAWSDLQGYTVTISGKSVNPPIEVLPATALGVIVA